MLMAFERYAPQCLRKAAIRIPSGVLHALPMAAAAATGRQIMQGIHPCGMVPHLTYMPPNADCKLPVHVVRAGIKPPLCKGRWLSAGEAGGIEMSDESLPAGWFRI